MADWDKIGSSGSVDDRRGAPGGLVIGGGVGVLGLLLLVGMNYLSGQSLLESVFQALNTTTTMPQQTGTPAKAPEDGYKQFASKVVGSTNDTWTQRFTDAGRTYAKPTLVLFRQATQSGCGVARSAVGPHYCPADRQIYLDETFFDELTRQFGAKGGDVAQGYVIAHEVGHHVQNQLNALGARTNEESVRVELQADCYAGVWAHDVQGKGIFEPGEIGEAIDAAATVGDDRIQEKVEGRVTPENWTHGSSAERVKWFNVGYETGDMQKCSA